MKNQALQKEILEKVKPGTKPSHLKKSKSTSDLPVTANQPITNQPRRSSVNPLTNPASLKKQLESAQSEVSTLGLQVEIQARELSEFKEENEHLKAQIEIKQKELEFLRKTLEEIRIELTQTQQELDASLEARHQALKVFAQEHEKRIQAQNELNNTVEESAEELTKNDQTITSLKSQLFKTQQQVNSLARDLDLSQRLIELRKNEPYFEPKFSASLTYLQYALYTLFTVYFLLALMQKKEVNYD